MTRSILGFLIVVASLFLVLRAAAAEPMQRMLVAPGCYELAPGQTAEVDAYCLDQERRAPPQGARLSETPRQLGEAVAVVGSGTVALSAAIAQGILQIEGMGEFSKVRLRNNSAGTIRICFQQPTVVMGVDGHTGTLTEAYEQIRSVVATSRPEPTANSDPKRHAETQREVWKLVRDAEEARKAPASVQATPTVRRAEKPARDAARRRECVGETGSATVCLER